MNVVLIAVDALRADRLGCYGYKKPTSPFIDSLAARGVLFENHFTPVVPTQPAFTTIFSGTHPLTHRIVAHEGAVQPNAGITWMPLLMRFHGLTTVAVDNLVDQKPWFARGFEYLINPRKRGEFPACDVFNERAIEWLTKNRREPFFMHLHFWDTHTPYLPPKHMGAFYKGDPTATNKGSLDAFYKNPQVDRWPKTWFQHLLDAWPTKSGKRIEDIEFIRAMYDAEVRVADDGVRELVETLAKLNLLDDTLLVIYSDHGEELGEHGVFFDHHGLYDSNLRCPMILHWPKGLAASAGKRVFAMSQHQDILATVLDALGKEVPTDVVEGRSLLPLARGQTELSHWNHTLMACESTWQAKWAMRTPEYKLIVSREPDFHALPPVEVYDLLDDPGERRNIAAENLPLTKTLLERFDARLKSMLEARGLDKDLIAAGGTTLGRRFFQQHGRPYPVKPDAKWQPHRGPMMNKKPAKAGVVK